MGLFFIYIISFIVIVSFVMFKFKGIRVIDLILFIIIGLLPYLNIFVATSFIVLVFIRVINENKYNIKEFLNRKIN